MAKNYEIKNDISPDIGKNATINTCSDYSGNLAGDNGVDLNLPKTTIGLLRAAELPPPPNPVILETPPGIVVETPQNRSPIEIYNEFIDSFQNILGPISDVLGNRSETKEQTLANISPDNNKETS